MTKVFGNRCTQGVAIEKNDGMANSTQPATQFAPYASLAGAGETSNPEDAPRRLSWFGVNVTLAQFSFR
jgi:hypothetical protein